MVVRWDDPTTEAVLNPRMPRADADRVRALIAGAGPLPGHVWLTTSGSAGRLKPVALAKRALLISADAVNRHLASGRDDVWLNVLPTFHVGGLGIYARAYLSGARVEALGSWDPTAFRAHLAAQAATLTSLVPAQVFDLVRAGHRPPRSLRAAIVGGGALDEGLRRQAHALGWPLLPSYGATECASQIATATLASLDAPAAPDLALLPHVTARTDAEGVLEIRSDALLTGYATEAGLTDPTRDGWWATGDVGEVRGPTLVVRGRGDDTVKVGGELVNLTALETRLAEVIGTTVPGTDAALVAVPDDRLGRVVGLAVVTTDPSVLARLQEAFNAAVLPFERARAVRMVPAIPRTALGKVVRGELAPGGALGDR